jgi:hypothetical protein
MLKIIKKIVKFGIIVAPAAYATYKYIKTIDSDSFTKKYTKRVKARVNNDSEEVAKITKEIHEELEPAKETFKTVFKFYNALYILTRLSALYHYYTDDNYVCLNGLVNIDTKQDVINIFRKTSDWTKYIKGSVHISTISLKKLIDSIYESGGTLKDVITSLSRFRKGVGISFMGDSVKFMDIFVETPIKQYVKK